MGTYLGVGGDHIHKIFSLNMKETIIPHWMEELAIQNLNTSPLWFEILKTIYALFLMKMGISSIVSVSHRYYIIKFCGSNIPVGGILFIITV